MGGTYYSYSYAGPEFHHLGFFGPGPAIAVLLAPLLLLAALALAVRGAGVVASRMHRPPPPPPRTPPESVHPVRASDAEREATVGHLSGAIAEGRLTIDEGTERIDAAVKARHRHELSRLVADLPRPQPTAPARAGSSAGRRAALAFATALALGALLLQALTGAWGLWPVAVGALAVTSLLPRR